MIRYALLCRHDHAFEAWFRDSEAYDLQRGDGHVACPVCGDVDVRKAVMAPAVRRAGKRPKTEAEAVVPTVAASAEVPPPTLPVAADDPSAKLRAAVRELHARIKRQATDVGPAFPEQARAIHEGEMPPRAIYGTATDREVRSLVEDGIGIVPIPVLPDDRN